MFLWHRATESIVTEDSRQRGGLVFKGWKASDELDFRNVQNETTMLSRNTGHQSLSDMVP